jgi:hypothetical protein
LLPAQVEITSRCYREGGMHRIVGGAVALILLASCAAPGPENQTFEPSDAELAQKAIHDCEATYPFAEGTAVRRAQCIGHIVAMWGQESPEIDQEVVALTAEAMQIDAGRMPPPASSGSVAKASVRAGGFDVSQNEAISAQQADIEEARSDQVQQEEADAAEREAEAAEQEARIARIEAILATFQSFRPVTTNCTQFGNTTSCQTW